MFKKRTVNLFDFLNSINSTKKVNLFAEGRPEKDYNIFIINRSLSYHSDTIMHANELNQRPFIPKASQYEYYLGMVRPRKRFAKWASKVSNPRALLVKEYYDVSLQKALEMVKLLTKEQIAQIESELNKGGT